MLCAQHLLSHELISRTHGDLYPIAPAWNAPPLCVVSLQPYATQPATMHSSTCNHTLPSLQPYATQPATMRYPACNRALPSLQPYAPDLQPYATQPAALHTPSAALRTQVDRNAAPFFGATSVGVHLHCFVRTQAADQGLRLHRAAD
mgnify:CR=1 FL=1